LKNSTPLKVLMLTSSYPRNATDNSSIFLRYLATNLAQQQVDVHVLAPDHPLVENPKLDAGVRNHWFQYLPKQWQQLAYGSGILPSLTRNKLLYLQIPFFLIAMFVSLFILCRKIKPNVIHAHWIIPQGFIAIIVGKLLNNIPTPSIIPMGVDVDHFQSGNADKLLDQENRKIILFVGRLVEKKGVTYLIEAFAKLPKKTQDDSILWIIGNGAERASLENQAKQLGITNIKFWGQIQNKQLPNFYAASTIFVAPSVIDSKGDTEGQGVILLEAMASKTPLIATTVGGIPEVITHNETGILVPPNNSNALSASIEYIFNNKDITNEYIKNAFIKVNNTYAWEAISKQFIIEFKSAISSKL